MRIGSLFSGIGGLELGLERAGLGRVVWQAECDAWCRGVLAAHWPDARRFDDVRAVRAGDAERVDVICGGFPCQDVSVAGKQKGMEHGTRSGLWSEYARIIGELRPSIVVIENVPGLRGRGLRRVLADLAGFGFDAEWTTLGAWEVGAPHKRDRLFIVAADPNRVELRDVAERLQTGRLDLRASGEGEPRHDGTQGDAANSDSARLEERQRVGCDDGEECAPAGRVGGNGYAWWARVVGWRSPKPVIRRMDDGVSSGLVDSQARLRALGNAVVPQCAEVIGRAILASLKEE